MYKLTITNKIKEEYKKYLKKILLTSKTKKFNASSKRFFNFLKNTINVQKRKDIYELILGNNLNSLISRYGEIYVDKKQYDIYNYVRNIFGYKLVELLNIKVCPYCNRNYITNFSNQTTIELDHFYPKSKYPYLAINIYNLIPVCHTCNHKKKEKSFKIYPFEKSIDDYFKFEFKGFDYNDKLNFLDENRLILDIDFLADDVGEWDYKNYILQNYQNHKDIIAEILKRNEMYPDSRIEELYNQFGGRLFNSKDELIGLIHCNYIDKKDINKRPLSKLTKDILEQLK